MTLAVDLVPHLDAGDRTKWQGDQDQRPLTELGRAQARAQALALAEALAVEPVDALYSGPALRCRQTLEPLAERLGLEIAILPELGEFEAWRAPDGWQPRPEEAPYISAFAAGSAMAAIEQIRREHPAGRVVACSHGHVIPALVSFLAGAYALRDVPEIRRGDWYRIRFDEARVSVEPHEADAGFPR